MVYCGNCGRCAESGDNYCTKCGTLLRKPQNSVLPDTVDCSPEIHHSDINRYIVLHQRSLEDVDRKLLQDVRVKVTESKQWVWKNAQITVYGKYLHVKFISGHGQTNKFVVQLNGDDRPVDIVEKEGFRLWFKNALATAWQILKDAVAPLAGALASGLSRKTIGY